MPVGLDGPPRSGTARGAPRGLPHGAPARGGENHARLRGAIAAAIALALATVTPGAGLAQTGFSSAPGFAAAEENPLVQRGVPAEATAENAVVARDRALASGQRIAYDRMAEALGLPRGLSDSQIEAAVASLVIESERITPRGYSARITVNFRPPASGLARPAAPLPGGTAGSPLGGPQAGAMPAGPAVATLDTVARYRSFAEYAELTRRLGASPAVARVEVLTVSGEMARLRLALRSPPQQAAGELAGSGLTLAPGPGTGPGEGWRLGFAGFR